MTTHPERVLVVAIRSGEWQTIWQLYEKTGVSRSTVAKTLWVLHAAGLVERRRVDEGRPEHEWRWITPTEENDENDSVASVERTDRRRGGDRRRAR